jgi:hypothetical protein
LLKRLRWLWPSSAMKAGVTETAPSALLACAATRACRPILL